MRATGIKMEAVIVSDSQNLAQEALELFVGDAQKAISDRAKGRFCVAISRHIPELFFELLGDEPDSKALPWDMIHLFWVDECCGSPDLCDTNYNLAARKFITKVGIPTENVHRICSENRNCGYVASIYEQTIYNVVGLKKNRTPRFDLIMLRMSADGHVASLFPDTYAFFETEDLVRVIYCMDGRYTRITLTNPVLRAASHIAVLVSGQEKAMILRDVFTNEPDQTRYPIHAIWPILDRVTWLIDRNATKFLRPSRLSTKVMTRRSKIMKSYKRL